ncbi:MAG: CarD family transcriptional regulator, partial [Pseudomonadota bacterium]
MKLPDLKGAGSTIFGGVADGMVGLVLGDLAQGRDVPILAVVRDAERSRAVQAGLAFFAPEVRVVSIPAWDCLPYDRVSPSADVAARRVSALSEVAAGLEGPCVVLTTANSIIQRVPPVSEMRTQALRAKPGQSVGMDDLVAWLEGKGFLRTSTVRETGEYAVRGGILDLWAPGEEAPVRLDFFGNTLETVRTFDPQTQRTVSPLKSLELVPMSEVPLSPETIKRFRQSYVAAFGAAGPDDALYAAISEGRRFAGAEHWMPLFYESLGTLFDYLPHSPVVLEPLIEEALAERDEQVHDYYEVRKRTTESASGAVPYKPLEPDALYVGEDELKESFAGRRTVRLTPFAQEGGNAVDLGGREGRSFAAERADENANVFDAVIAHLRDRQKAGKRASIACWSEGSRDRMAAVLEDRGVGSTVNVGSWAQLRGLGKKEIGLSVLSLESGFETPQFAIVGEQDVLGDRLVRNKRKSKRGADVLTEMTSLDVDDYVVHIEHGIGRFAGLKTIDVGNAPHDCLEIHYAGNDKLYLPVENIELLSRYGSEDAGVNLDKLGGVGWQNRKARLKNRLRDMAGKLIEIAAARALRDAPILTPPEGVWDEFNARFPY